MTMQAREFSLLCPIWLDSKAKYLENKCFFYHKDRPSRVLTSLLANSFPFFTSSFGLMPLRNLASVTTAFLPAEG